MNRNYPSMPPGAIIGYLDNGKPVRIVAGGSGEGEDDTATGQGSAAGDATGDAGQQNGQDGTSTAGAVVTGQDGGGSGGTAGGDDKTNRTISAIRDDFKAERSRRQALEKQLADLQAAQNTRAEEDKARNLALAKAFGFAPDETPDPAKLAADLKAAQEQTATEIAKRETRERELTIELETRRRAAKLGADPDLLADSRSFMNAVSKLDPSGDSFGDDLADAIKRAVEANPSLKGAAAAASTAAAGEAPKPGNQSATTAPPARSGGEHNGAAGGNRQWTDDDVAALPKTREGARQLQEAIDAGLLQDLGFGPRKKR